MVDSVLPWIIFHLLIFVFIVIDLRALNNTSRTITIRESLSWTAMWITLSLSFCFGIYLTSGKEPAITFLTGYLIEKSLSVDNLFLFLVIFTYFKIPQTHQHQILFWGIIGALIMRAIFILGGIVLVSNFGWILYLFGIFLIITGIRMAFKKEEEVRPEDNPIFRFLVRWTPYTHELHGKKFFIKKGTQWLATPLFLALLFIEIVDIIFALDSIPAIFAITLDPFIIYTSNIFAIIGLRSLFFSMSGLLPLFTYLHYGLAAVLTLIGFKMLFAHYIEIPPLTSLLLIIGILGTAILASVIDNKLKKS
jgi:integral membrane protein, TerC family